MSSSLTPWFGFSSSASPENVSKDPVKTSEESKVSDQNEQDKAEDQTNESDGESECDLSRDELIKLAVEKDELLKLKHKEIEIMKDKVLRTYAEMENVMDRTKRDAENSKKFAIQSIVVVAVAIAAVRGVVEFRWNAKRRCDMVWCCGCRAT